MEFEVGEGVGARIPTGAVHAVEGLVQVGKLVFRASLGSEAGRSGFDEGTQFSQVGHEPGGVTASGTPAHDVGVEQVPLGARTHEGAAFLAGVHEAFGGEYPHAFPHHAHAHTEFGAQGAQVEGVAFADHSGGDAFAEEFDDAAVDAPPGVGAAHGHAEVL